jgi:chromosome segregation ATPase
MTMKAGTQPTDAQLSAEIERLISKGMTPTVNEFMAVVGGNRTSRSKFLRSYLSERNQLLARRYSPLPDSMQNGLDVFTSCLQLGIANVREDMQATADVVQKDLSRQHASALAGARRETEQADAELARVASALETAEQKLAAAELALAKERQHSASLQCDLVSANASVRQLTVAVERRDNEVAALTDELRLEQRERARLAGALHDCRRGVSPAERAADARGAFMSRIAARSRRCRGSSERRHDRGPERLASGMLGGVSSANPPHDSV